MSKEDYDALITTREHRVFYKVMADELWIAKVGKRYE